MFLRKRKQEARKKVIFIKKDANTKAVEIQEPPKKNTAGSKRKSKKEEAPEIITVTENIAEENNETEKIEENGTN